MIHPIPPCLVSHYIGMSPNPFNLRRVCKWITGMGMMIPFFVPFRVVFSSGIRVSQRKPISVEIPYFLEKLRKTIDSLLYKLLLYF